MATAARRTPRTPVPEVPERIIRPAAARARAAVSVAGRAVTTATAYETETQAIEDMGDIVFPPGTEAAFVRVGAGKTINLGNYESLRIDVSVTLPCLTSKVSETFQSAADFVADKLLEEEHEWMRAAQPKPKATRR